MKKILLAVGVWVALSGMAWAGLNEGLVAAQRGDYATALNEWQPLAKQGNAGAQYNLGVSYANGEGVPKNAVEAVAGTAWRQTKGLHRRNMVWA